MNWAPPRRWACVAILALLLVGAAAGLARAGGEEPTQRAAPVLRGEWQWWSDMKTWFSAQASNRSRIVQFGLVGMVVALLILYSASNRKR